MKMQLIDQKALIQQFAEASTKQGAALRKSVNEATLGALKARELSLTNIKQVLKAVSEATAKGAAASPLPMPDVEALLGQALAGVDSALVQAVEANRRALQQLVAQGVAVQESHVKKAMSEIDKLEDSFFAAVDKAMAGADMPLQGAFGQVMTAFKTDGTQTGARAKDTLAQLSSSARDAMRDQRAVAVAATQAWLDGYSALVSGVLLGMSEALTPGAAAAPKKGK